MVAIETLKEISIFAGLAEYELEHIAKISHEEVLEEDKRIFAEGALADKLYIVVEGEVAIKITACGIITVDTVCDGEVFGWSALTEPYSLTAAAYTTKKTRLIAIAGDVLRDLFGKNNHIGYVVIKELASVISNRLKQSRNSLVGCICEAEKKEEPVA